METNKSEIDKNLSKMEDQLKAWGTKLEEVVAKVNTAGQQAKVDSQKHVDELKVKLAAAQAKLAEAKAAGGERWDSFKQGVEHAWKELESGFKKLVH